MTEALTVFLDPRERLYGYDRQRPPAHPLVPGDVERAERQRLWNNPIGRGVARRLAARGRRILAERHANDRGFHTTDAGGTDTMGGGDPVRVSMVAGCDPILPQERTHRGALVRHRVSSARREAAMATLPSTCSVSRAKEPGPVDDEELRAETRTPAPVQIHAYNALSVANAVAGRRHECASSTRLGTR